MLKEYLKKVFNPAQATQEEIISMTTEENQVAAMAADNTAELTATLNTVTEAMATLQADFAEMKTNYEAAQVALSASAEAQATLVANAKATVMTSRSASLSAIMGDVKGPQMATSLESLDDATFATVLSGYAASFEAEEKSEMFQEKGAAAEAAPVVEVDAVKTLAASIAAKFQTK